VERERPPLVGTEKEMLLGWLRYARATVDDIVRELVDGATGQ
jgi:hypothetical protein